MCIVACSPSLETSIQLEQKKNVDFPFLFGLESVIPFLEFIPKKKKKNSQPRRPQRIVCLSVKFLPLVSKKLYHCMCPLNIQRLLHFI